VVPRHGHAEGLSALLTTLAVLSFAIWCWLLTRHGGFWQSGPELPMAVPDPAPPVAIIVPARNEAEQIDRVLRSLLAQTYPGWMDVILVDDDSNDHTADIARAIGDPRLTIVKGGPRPAGWAGKLWAVHQGIQAAGKTGYYFLTDADIEHDPLHLATLVAAAEREGLDMVSEMVSLACDSWAEKALVPAFVYFFQLLYPFVWVNDPQRATAAAAGGTVLIHERAMKRIGGMEAIRGALIDDVTLARTVKTGGRIFLGHATMARSIRPYPGLPDIWRMVARSAYAQLHFSRVLLLLTTLAMAVVWLVPPIAALFGHGVTRTLGAVTWAMFAVSFFPTLRRYHRSLLWAAGLPLIALFYMAATIGSAINHHLGRGVVWKGRAYAGGAP
jgi:hopene-associated glycosyltransferase HpnB